jgi:hypothetical protein
MKQKMVGKQRARIHSATVNTTQGSQHRPQHDWARHRRRESLLLLAAQMVLFSSITGITAFAALPAPISDFFVPANLSYHVRVCSTY